MSCTFPTLNAIGSTSFLLHIHHTALSTRYPVLERRFLILNWLSCFHHNDSHIRNGWISLLLEFKKRSHSLCKLAGVCHINDKLFLPMLFTFTPAPIPTCFFHICKAVSETKWKMLENYYDFLALNEHNCEVTELPTKINLF